MSLQGHQNRYKYKYNGIRKKNESCLNEFQHKAQMKTRLRKKIIYGIRDLELLRWAIKGKKKSKVSLGERSEQRIKCYNIIKQNNCESKNNKGGKRCLQF